MKQLFLYFFFGLPLVVSCQNGSYLFGARSTAMAGASATLIDGYSLFNNAAAMGLVEKTSLFAGYENRYGLPEFQTIGAGMTLVHPLANIGLGWYKFGDALFSEQRIHTAVAKKIQRVSLGISAGLLQYHIESLGTRRTLLVEFGGVVTLSPQFSFAGHISNLSQSRLRTEIATPIPTLMRAGLAYTPTKALTVTVELEKNVNFREVFKTGLEYKLTEAVLLRSGIRTAPVVAAFGLGVLLKKMVLDYAFQNHTVLGNTHTASLAYLLQK